MPVLMQFHRATFVLAASLFGLAFTGTQAAMTKTFTNGRGTCIKIDRSGGTGGTAVDSCLNLTATIARDLHLTFNYTGPGGPSIKNIDIDGTLFGSPVAPSGTWRGKPGSTDSAINPLVFTLSETDDLRRVGPCDFTRLQLTSAYWTDAQGEPITTTIPEASRTLIGLTGVTLLFYAIRSRSSKT